MASFDFVDLDAAMAQKSTGRATNDKKQTEMDDLLRQVSESDRAVKLSPATGETQRGLRLRIAQAIKRTGLPVLAFTGKDGSVYAHKDNSGSASTNGNKAKADPATAKPKAEPAAAKA